MPQQVFFSYANAQDTLLALQALAIEVEKAGMRAWYDRKRLVAGQTFDSEIMTQVRASAAIVLLANPVTFGSAWVLKEIQAAHALRIPIVPCFLLPSAVPPEFRPILGPLNHLELFRYARDTWGQALLWTLFSLGLHFDWPAAVPREPPPLQADIATIHPPYGVLRHADRKQLEEMMMRMSGALDRNERWGYGHLNLALVLLHLGDRDRAIFHLENAATHLPRIGDPFYFLALALLAFIPLRRTRPAPLGKAEAALAVARRLDPERAIFAVLDDLIAIEYYKATGFRRNGGSDGTGLLRNVRAARSDAAVAEELDRLLATIPVSDRLLHAIMNTT